MGQIADNLHISVNEYLAGEQHSEVRHEYINGQVYAMVGASKAHNSITLNMAAALRAHLQGGPCRVYMADIKVHVSTKNDERFFYPDVLVECVPLETGSLVSRQPRLIVEVLSESTERNDRADKFYAYRRLESLEEYLLVAQDVPRVEIYRRTTGWDLEIYQEEEDFTLASAELTLPVAAVYEGLSADFADGPR